MKNVRLALGGALLALTVSVAAQVPGGGPPGGGGGMPPQMQKFMAQNKYKMQMRQQIRAINEINRNPATAITSAQAKQLLGILKPWTTKPKMTEEDAKGIMRSVKKVMNARQLTAMGNVKPQRGFGGGGRQGGGPGGPGGGPGAFGGRPGGGPGGPGGPGGGGPRFDPNRMKDMNFLSTKADPNNPRTSRRVEGNKRMIAMLEAKARGGSATAKR
jgi:hypothetical protein